MKSQAFLWATLLAATAFAALAQEPPALTDDQILVRCLAELKNALVPQELEHYSFTKRVTAESLDKNGNIKHQSQAEFELVPRPDGRVVMRLLSVNGAPPSEKELRQVEKQTSKELAMSDEEFEKEKRKARESNTMLSGEFLQEFDFKYAGRENWTGTPAFRIEFAPKPKGAQPQADEGKILRKMAGQLWVSQSSFRILATEMHNIETVKIWLGYSGIDHIVDRVEYLPATDGPYLPKVDSVQWEQRIGLMNRFRFSRKEEYSNFQKIERAP